MERGLRVHTHLSSGVEDNLQESVVSIYVLEMEPRYSDLVASTFNH